MRISAQKGDPFYRYNARMYAVAFNGERVRPQLLITADDETGLLITHKIGPSGTADHNTSVIQKGEVCIIPPAEAWTMRVPEEVPFG